jgi:hypothetical protein
MADLSKNQALSYVKGNNRKNKPSKGGENDRKHYNQPTIMQELSKSSIIGANSEENGSFA